MKKRIALVTGSSRGIGRKIACRLAEDVSGVAVHYHSSRDDALGVAADIEKTGTRSRAFSADLRERGDAEALVQKIEKAFGQIDILVNNVGPILVKPWEDVEGEEWDRIFSGNVKTAVLCMKAVLPGMRKRKWGRIINIGYSRVEHLGSFPTITPYAVAKAGLLILTRTAAVTEGPAGVTVNMVSPGLIEGGVLPPRKNIPLGRLGTFDDVAEAVAFLASERAGYITGTNLIVAGGWKI